MYYKVSLIRRALFSRGFDPITITRRTFASTPIAGREWILIIPDKPGVLERRLKIRPVHSKNFRELHQAGHVSWGGPMFTNHVEDGTTRPFRGSVLVMNGESEDEVLAKIKSDVYVKDEIWNLEEAKIYPFVTKERSALTEE